MFVITTRNSDKSLTVESLVVAKAKARALSAKYGRTFTVRRLEVPEVLTVDVPVPSIEDAAGIEPVGVCGTCGAMSFESCVTKSGRTAKRKHANA